MKKRELMEKNVIDDPPNSEKLGQHQVDVEKSDLMGLSEKTESIDVSKVDSEIDKDDETFNTGDNVNSNSISESKNEDYESGNSVKRDDTHKVDESRGVESKLEERKLEGNIQQVGLSDKMDGGNSFDCKVEDRRKQNTVEKLGGEEQQEPVFNKIDIHSEIDKNDEKFNTGNIVNNSSITESKSEGCKSIDVSKVDSEIDKDGETFNTGDNVNSNSILESKYEDYESGNSVKCDDTHKVDVESKLEERKLKGNIQQVGLNDKMDGGNSFGYEVEDKRKQTTVEKLGGEEQQEPVFNKIDIHSEIDKNDEKFNTCDIVNNNSITESKSEGCNSGSSVIHDDFDKVDESRVIESKLEDDIQQVGGNSSNYKVEGGRKQTTGEKLDSEEQQEPVFNEIEIHSEIDKDDEKFKTGDNVNNNSIAESICEGYKSGSSVKHDDIHRVDENRDIDSKLEEKKLEDDVKQVGPIDKMDAGNRSVYKVKEGRKQTKWENVGGEEQQEPIFSNTEVHAVETNRSTTSLHSINARSETEGSIWPEKAVAIKDFVKSKGAFAVNGFLRVLSGRRDGDEQFPLNEEEASNSTKNKESSDVSKKPGDRSSWKLLSYIMTARNSDAEKKVEEAIEEPPEPRIMKGRIILYTRLGCQDCKEARLFLYNRRLRYVEINVDVYPSRKLELERFTGSSAVPKVFFNEVLIGGMSELKGLDESGKLDEKINYLVTEAPSREAPLPPLSGEDDVSTSGSVDELALVVRKMKESIVVKDRFYKMQRFNNCFLGSDAVKFLSEDQYLEREDAIEFGRKLASKLFFRHILEENLFEDGNHLYRFLDDDPIVSSQCHNIPRGIIVAKPKPITDIASRLRFLFYAINEAYTSEDGKHVDYRSIHGSEEFARYLRIIQELQRVEPQSLSREEKLAFFINLYNMMIIHAILVLGHPSGALDRRKFFGDFKYIIGGCTYSLSIIQNGILRSNQRPPYNLMKPFGVDDKRCKVSIPYPEPLIHFALVNGTRSGPPLQCYSPANVDKELMDAARNFLRGGGLIIDANAKVAYVSKILKWFSIDFGKNEEEVLKHASNYLEPESSAALLELLADGQLKVQYQAYDWGLNL